MIFVDLWVYLELKSTKNLLKITYYYDNDDNNNDNNDNNGNNRHDNRHTNNDNILLVDILLFF